jgi:hypothetical protein
LEGILKKVARKKKTKYPPKDLLYRVEELSLHLETLSRVIDNLKACLNQLRSELELDKK